MIHELDLYGMFVSPMMLWVSVAVLLTGLLSLAMSRLGLYRFVWHKPLFDLALLVILLGGVAAATPW
ncbi:DUF1656 domain-containing protein [Reyranella sp.]|uniref:DUF1656 domain-containing protein n=1 Tax=Reyranella sp. TaxID=1929291 RepID=UPI003D144DC6